MLMSSMHPVDSYCSVSVLRVLDLVMSVLSGLLSFGVSVTLHAGLNHTCAAFSKDSG